MSKNYSCTKKGPGRTHRQGGLTSKRHELLRRLNKVSAAAEEYSVFRVKGIPISLVAGDKFSMRDGVLLVKSRYGTPIGKVVL